MSDCILTIANRRLHKLAPSVRREPGVVSAIAIFSSTTRRSLIIDGRQSCGPLILHAIDSYAMDSS
jgi:hypothetical protein